MPPTAESKPLASPPGRRHRDRASWWIAAAALLVGGLYLGAEIYLFGAPAFPLDDSWIHLQFARQVAAGEGLSYQQGRWVGGSTAPLWTVLLALGSMLPLSLPAWAKLLGVALFAALAVATAKLAAELDLSPLMRRLAAALVLLTPWLAWSALSGMEILLFAWLSVWGLTLHLRERRDPARPPLSLVALALGVLARPEGAFLLALAVVERLLNRRDTTRRDLVDALLPAAIVLLPTLLIYRLLGGSWLPTTFAVKASAPADLIPSGRYLQAVVNTFFRSQPLMLLCAAAGALRLVERLGTPRDRGWLLAAWPLGLPLAYALLASDRGPIVVGNFGRYYFPLLPVIVVLGLLGIEPAVEHLRRRFTAHRWLIPGVVALIVAPSLWLAGQGLPRYLQTVANVEDSDVRAARWLAERLPAEAVVAVQDIGAVKYHLPNAVIDLAGIVNPEILPQLKGTGEPDEPYWERRLLAFLEPRRPDYLLVFERSYPMLTSPAPGFATVRSFEIENNVTMAGDTLVLLSTPWLRHPLHATGDAE